MNSGFEDSCTMLLHRLSLERVGWRRYWYGRWLYPDEPLRNDAAALLRHYRLSLKLEPRTGT